MGDWVMGDSKLVTVALTKVCWQQSAGTRHLISVPRTAFAREFR